MLECKTNQVGRSRDGQRAGQRGPLHCRRRQHLRPRSIRRGNPKMTSHIFCIEGESTRLQSQKISELTNWMRFLMFQFSTSVKKTGNWLLYSWISWNLFLGFHKSASLRRWHAPYLILIPIRSLNITGFCIEFFKCEKRIQTVLLIRRLGILGFHYLQTRKWGENR